ncbi:MAG TPA: TrbG/VirB9 family P-type conjugative transfer protein [Nevskiaceae bacterium]|nr:TrbG/VirB9 family P-type conjugative transfer protein [Nevskiaceae bacterium]
MWHLAQTALLTAGLVLCGTVVAAPPRAPSSLSPNVDAAPILNESRMVTYTWVPGRSYVIRALGGVDTFVTVPKGEVVQGFYLSNDADWHYMVTKDRRRVLIKPASAGLYTTALLVTNEHSYPLTLASVGGQTLWFQTVTWRIPGPGHNATGAYWQPPGSDTASSGNDGAPDAGHSASTSNLLANVNPNHLYFKYKISGNAAFRPVTVFDNGKFTWLRLRPGVQDLPAVFAQTDGKVDVVNYRYEDHYILIPRVADEIVLRLNRAKVTIRRACNPTRCLE